MDLVPFRELSARLTANLSARPEVRGLIFLGSAADGARTPDEYSDHDFFVVAEDAEQLRNNLDWVPDHLRLVWVHRETAHGLKLLYDDGHLLELAVFTSAELGWARGDTWRVAFDRGGQPSLEQHLRENLTRVRPPPSDRSWLLRQGVLDLVIGARRWARGERLAAHRRVFADALPKLLEVLVTHVPAEHPELVDPLDPLRRVELSRPALGRAVGEVLLWPADRAAAALFELVVATVTPTADTLPSSVVATVRQALAPRTAG
jgi:hypothetical protein